VRNKLEGINEYKESKIINVLITDIYTAKELQELKFINIISITYFIIPKVV